MSQLISALAVGAKVKYGSYKVESSTTLPIIFKIIGKNHAGYPANSVTLLTDKIIDLRGFDAKEPTNTDSARASYGNNRYRTSNLRQWLNSGGAANAWWVAQNLTDGTVNTNNKDATPADAGMSYTTGYNDIPGFMSNFTTQELGKMLSTTLTIAKNTVTDGGASETVTDQVFLLSNTEVGLANENSIVEGSVFTAVSANRMAYMTDQGFTNTLSTNKPATVGTAWYWWLRTPYASASHNARKVYSDGTLYYDPACGGDNGLRPALNLANDILVSDTTDSDGCYTVVWSVPANTLAKSTVSIISPANTPVKSSVNLSNSANVSLNSAVNLTNSANTLAKSTVNITAVGDASVSLGSLVTIIGAVNTPAKSIVNIGGTANVNLDSVVNVTAGVNTPVKSTVIVGGNANVSLSSTLRIESSQIPSLYVFSAAEQLQTILVNQGESCPFYNPYHDEKINLENTFTFEIPADHADAQFVVEGSLIAFQDLDANWQVFEVKRIIDIDDTSTIKQVFCDHAFYELLGDIVPSGGGAETSAWIAMTSALSQSRWEVGNVVNLGIQTTVFSYQTALSCLQQIATTWMGELQFRIIIVNGVITHRYVDLVVQRGTSAGKQFVFGKDLEKVEREVDFNGLYTAMYGRGKATTEGARLNFASINAGLEYVTDAGALASYGIMGRHRFGIFDDSQEADPTILLAKTTAALQLAKVPIVNYQFQVISLEQISSDYSHEAVRIGDTCTSLDDNFVPALQVGVRVIEIKRNLLEYDKTQITLGNFRLDLANSQISQINLNRQVQDNSGIWDNGAALTPSVIDPAMYDLTSKLRAAGGYVVFDPVNGIMIYDTPDPAMATKAMKLGAGIFGIADSKTLGVWNWRTFGDGNGFTADLMTAGKMMADRIQIGTGAQALGFTNFYWDTSGLYAINGLNVVRITPTGISLSTNGVGGAFSSALTTEGLDANNAPIIATGTVINSNGVAITNGRLSVTNPVGTVIIDGSSNMFKIVATGTAQATVVTNGGVTDAYVDIYHNLGYCPAALAFVTDTYDNVLSSLPKGDRTSGVSEWVGIFPDRIRLYLHCTWTGQTVTATFKYYILKEASI